MTFRREKHCEHRRLHDCRGESDDGHAVLSFLNEISGEQIGRNLVDR